MKTNEALRLAQMRPGERAVVQGYGQGAERYRRKLLSFGLTAGTPIRLIKLAPLGDPVLIEVRGFSLSLRKEEADVLQLRRDS